MKFEKNDRGVQISKENQNRVFASLPHKSFDNVLIWIFSSMFLPNTLNS